MAETVKAKQVEPKAAAPKAPATSSPALPKEVFGIKVNTQAIFDSIMSERASQRQGTHKVKTRGEVRGGGRKPFAQKGTGNARSGSIRSPQNVGGGVVWGPTTERNYTLKVNKKVKKLAYNSAWTLKAKDNAIIVKDLSVGEKPSTKALIKQIADLKLKKEFKKLLIITNDFNVIKSAANIQKLFALPLSNVTVETIVNVDAVIFSKESMNKIGGKK